MSNDHAAPVAELSRVTVRFGRQLVLDRVDLAIMPRDFIALIGPNGGGKSTLLKTLLGLVVPESGQVRLWGSPAGRARHRIGYVPQHASFRDAFPVTVEEVVGMGRLYQRGLLAGPTREDRGAVEHQIERLGLQDKRNHQASGLSGGERQRVLIARALCTEPEILLLDEPTASLDTRATAQVYDLLEELNQTLPILLVSHDLTAISQRVKSVGCLNGRLFYHGDSELSEEMVAAAYGCPVDLIAHGHPHRVLALHPEEEGEGAPG